LGRPNLPDERGVSLLEVDLITKLLQDAENLKDEREDLKERTIANRKALRVMAEAGLLNDTQLVALGKYYPERKKKETTTPEDTQ
jgi:cytochrome c553